MLGYPLGPGLLLGPTDGGASWQSPPPPPGGCLGSRFHPSTIVYGYPCSWSGLSLSISLLACLWSAGAPESSSSGSLLECDLALSVTSPPNQRPLRPFFHVCGGWRQRGGRALDDFFLCLATLELPSVVAFYFPIISKCRPSPSFSVLVCVFLR